MSSTTQKDEQVILLNAILEPIRKPLESLESRFKEHIRSDNPVIQEMVNYVFAKSGKRLRPALVFISSMIWDSSNYTQIVDLALSIELIHLATLVHDDVLDRSEQRRGIETYNKKWGNTPSILFGDFLFSRAFVILAQLGNLKIIQNLSKTTSEVCEGEIIQSFSKNNIDISLEKYLTIARYKTASLIAESCRVGALISGLGKENEEQLYHFGLNLGMAFQIYDDYLDFQADEKTLGKPILNDITNGCITLPIIHLLNQPSNGSRDQFLSNLNEINELDRISNIKKLLKQYHSLDYTLEMAKDYVNKAKNVIQNIQNPKLKEYLSKIAQFIVTRQF